MVCVSAPATPKRPPGSPSRKPRARSSPGAIASSSAASVVASNASSMTKNPSSSNRRACSSVIVVKGSLVVGPREPVVPRMRFAAEWPSSGRYFVASRRAAPTAAVRPRRRVLDRDCRGALLDCDARDDLRLGHDDTDELHVDLAQFEERVAPRVEQRAVGGADHLHPLGDEAGEAQRRRRFGIGVVVATPRVRTDAFLADHEPAFDFGAHAVAPRVAVGVNVTTEVQSRRCGSSEPVTVTSMSTYVRPRLS